MGKEIGISPPKINHVSRIPNFAINLESLCSELNEHNLENEFFIFPPPTSLEPSSVNRLSFHDRILHLLLCWFLRPSGREYSLVKSENLFFMHHIKQQQINLGLLILKDVMEVIKGRNKRLVHGMVISQLMDALKVDTYADLTIICQSHKTIKEVIKENITRLKGNGILKM